MAMASILAPEDVVRQIAAECTFIDERDAVGIRFMLSLRRLGLRRLR